MYPTIGRVLPMMMEPKTGVRIDGGKEKLSGGVTAVIVLICLGLVGAVGYFVYKRKRTMSTTVIASPDLQLEADGEVLQRAVESGVHNKWKWNFCRI